MRSDIPDTEFNGEYDRRKNFENYVLLWAVPHLWV
jgi:hypothetical protein